MVRPYRGGPGHASVVPETHEQRRGSETRKCLVCGSDLTGSKNRGLPRVTCSVACRAAHRRARDAAIRDSSRESCSTCGKPTRGLKQTGVCVECQRARPCVACGRPVGKRARRTCSPRCTSVAQASAASRSRRGDKREHKACAWCGDDFVVKGRRTKFCGNPCKWEFARHGLARAPSVHECVVCGETWRGEGRSTFCGPVCRAQYATSVKPMFANAKGRRSAQYRHEARARSYGVPVEKVLREEVFARDGWRCMVCGNRTPKKWLGTTHPRAPELDHRVPLAKGGGHVWANAQTSCRRCNGKKTGIRARGQMTLLHRMEG